MRPPPPPRTLHSSAGAEGHALTASRLAAAVLQRSVLEQSTPHVETTCQMWRGTHRLDRSPPIFALHGSYTPSTVLRARRGACTDHIAPGGCRSAAKHSRLHLGTSLQMWRGTHKVDRSPPIFALRGSYTPSTVLSARRGACTDRIAPGGSRSAANHSRPHLARVCKCGVERTELIAARRFLLCVAPIHPPQFCARGGGRALNTSRLAAAVLRGGINKHKLCPVCQSSVERSGSTAAGCLFATRFPHTVQNSWRVHEPALVPRQAYRAARVRSDVVTPLVLEPKPSCYPKPRDGSLPTPGQLGSELINFVR